MVSLLVLTRDAPQLATACLDGLLATTAALRSEHEFEFVLIDDHSNPAHGIVESFKRLRMMTASPVQIIRFKSHQHYAHGLAFGFAAARGSSVLFISHDMVVTPSCVRTLLELAAVSPAYGIIRPVSQHLDFAQQMTVRPPFAMRGIADANNFSRFMRACRGLERTTWGVLIGDAMLVQRSVIDKIGVPDMRFFGFMADIDYGIRARRAGFSMPLAHGAWLHHHAKGHAKEAASDPESYLAIQTKNVADADRAWILFRNKWGGKNLPESYRMLDIGSMRSLERRGPVDGSSDYHAPPRLDPSVCEIH